MTASDDRTARLWDAKTGKELARLAHENSVKAAAFSPDGAKIVTASWDKTARLWDAATGKERRRTPMRRTALRRPSARTGRRS